MTEPIGLSGSPARELKALDPEGSWHPRYYRPRAAESSDKRAKSPGFAGALQVLQVIAWGRNSTFLTLKTRTIRGGGCGSTPGRSWAGRDVGRATQGIHGLPPNFRSWTLTVIELPWRDVRDAPVLITSRSRVRDVGPSDVTGRRVLFFHVQRLTHSHALTKHGQGRWEGGARAGE
jgi:hypothetical protein